MKKFIVTLILSLILTVLFQKSYISNYSITVSFDITTKKAINLQVLYTKNQKDDFNIKDVVTRHITPSEKNIRINLPITHIYKFRLDPGENPGSVTIDNIVISSGKKQFVFTDMTKFSTTNLTVNEIKGSRIRLNSNHNDPYIWFNGIVDLNKSKEIDWSILSIVFILSLLISYKLCPIALYKFKSVKCDNREAVVFCLIFFILLLIPCSKMDKREIATEENRKLAVFPHFFQPGKKGLNLNFGKEFDTWFQDRFNRRKIVINRYNKVISKIDGNIQNKYAILYPSGWMFYKPWVERIFTKPKVETMQKIKDNLLKINKFCIENNIKLYTLICPIKEDIYYKENLQTKSCNYEENTIFVEYVKNSAPELNIIYPRSELQNKKFDANLLFYKTDTHQTYDGAYLINLPLLQAIQKDFPLLKTPNIKNDFEQFQDTLVGVSAYYQGRRSTGYIYGVLGLNNTSLLNVKYNYYRLKDKNSFFSTENKKIELISKFNRGYGKAVIIGDSFAENQTFWLQYSFKETYKFSANYPFESNEMRRNYWQQQIKVIQPDVLILCLSASQSLTYLLNF